MDREPSDVGDELGSDVGSLSSLLGDFYRGEMDRMTSWRGRLDTTTNWAVTIMAAILTWVFSSPDNPHYLLLIGMGAVGVFHAIETKRYRMYDVWRSRVRLMEQDVFAPTFAPDVDVEHGDWRHELATDLRRPALKVPLLEAYQRRLRRVYLPLLYVLLAAWLVRIAAFSPSQGAIQAASAEGVPGVVILAAVGTVYAAWTALAFWPRERKAMGELHEVRKEGEWKEE